MKAPVQLFASIDGAHVGRVLCSRHPGYEAKRRPTSDCETCDVIWRIAKAVRGA